VTSLQQEAEPGVGGLLLLASLFIPNHGTLAATSPFHAMAGAWSGGGTLTMSSGTQERVRCRASYGVAGRGENLTLNLRCASDSYNFDLAGDVAIGTAPFRARGARLRTTRPAPSRDMRAATASWPRPMAAISRRACH
jgi:hypothetical protein